MILSSKTTSIRAFFVNLCLLFFSVLLFALPQPNLISTQGFPFLAYIAFVPLFILIRRISFKASFLWGGFYGLFCYSLFTYWLGVFHPLAMYVIAIQYFFYCLLLIPFLKGLDIFFPKKGYIFQWLAWIGYEYIKTKGFVGYSYGIIGYSQWSWPLISQIAAIFGVWGVSALVTFPSAWIAAAIKPVCHRSPKYWLSQIKKFAKQEYVSAVLWLLCFFLSLFYGLKTTKTDYKDNSQFTIALIQPNSDPWKGGLDEYKRDFEILVRLSNEALEKNPEIQMVVWPETGFIPRIDWHYRYREDQDSWLLVDRLLRYLDSASVPFVIGNDNAIMGFDQDGNWGRIDYNAVYLFKPSENVLPPKPDVYNKMHLVPFTEHFPYKKQFPWIYDLLVATDTHFWEQGSDPYVFSVDSLHFSTPICFEDTFGYISRKFVLNGAQAIVNLTNDAWAKSIPCQYQHLSMAVFRAIENRVPLVRSTATGQTAIVSPYGKIIAMAEPFTETYIVGQIPILSKDTKTVYTIVGDALGFVFFAVSVSLFCLGCFLFLLRKNKKEQYNTVA